METKIDVRKKNSISLEDFCSNGFLFNRSATSLHNFENHLTHTSLKEEFSQTKFISDQLTCSSSFSSADSSLRNCKKSISISSPTLYFLPDFSSDYCSFISESSVFENNVNHNDLLDRVNCENNFSFLKRFLHTNSHVHKKRPNSSEFSENFSNTKQKSKSLESLFFGRHTRSENYDELNIEINEPLMRKIRILNLHRLMEEIRKKIGHASDKEIELMKRRLLEGHSHTKIVDDWLKKVKAFLKTFGANMKTLNKSLLKIMIDSLVQSPDDLKLASKLFIDNWNSRLSVLKAECYISGLSDEDYNRTLSSCFGDIYEAKISLIKEEIYPSLWPSSSRSTWKHIVRVLRKKEENSNQAESYKRRVRMILAEKKIFGVDDEETAKKIVRIIDQLMEHMSQQQFLQEEEKWSLLTSEFDIEALVEKAKKISDYKKLIFTCICCSYDYPINQAVRFDKKCDCLYCKACGARYFESKIDQSTAVNIDKLTCLGCTKIIYDTSPYFFAVIKKLVGEKHYDKLSSWFKPSSLEDLIDCLCCGVQFLVPSGTKFEVKCPHCTEKFCITCYWRGPSKHQCYKKENTNMTNIPNLIECPECKTPVEVVRGGCLHLTCFMCKHEFCSGCCNPFKRTDTHGLFCVHERNCFGSLRDYDVKNLESLIRSPNIYLEDYSLLSPLFFSLLPEEKSSLKNYCNVLVQKDDNPEESCSQLCYPSSKHFCENHYKEYLVMIIQNEKIDPVDIMDISTMKSYLKNRRKFYLISKDERILRKNIARNFPLR